MYAEPWSGALGCQREQGAGDVFGFLRPDADRDLRLVAQRVLEGVCDLGSQLEQRGVPLPLLVDAAQALILQFVEHQQRELQVLVVQQVVAPPQRRVDRRRGGADVTGPGR